MGFNPFVNKQASYSAPPCIILMFQAIENNLKCSGTFRTSCIRLAENKSKLWLSPLSYGVETAMLYLSHIQVNTVIYGAK